MTKILYIPNGEYIKFVNVYFSREPTEDRYTEILENAVGFSSDGQETIEDIVYNARIILFKTRNKLPTKLLESEFEVIYD